MVLGIPLDKVTIMLSALGVGIGFGLQNLVNNFVSGLILLVERPVSVGDWVIVGGHEGYVKRVNIRSTEIETFTYDDQIVRMFATATIVWGLVGSTHSRFSDFLVGPRKIIAYLRGENSGSVGHNPLGGWSVVALLSLLLLQAVSGLFNSDDVFFSGPLYYAASGEFRDTMGVVHEFFRRTYWSV